MTQAKPARRTRRQANRWPTRCTCLIRRAAVSSKIVNVIKGA
jgi:hypothetical protein